MSVTIRDVAQRAGVSKATVSKVLNDSYSISQATKDRVQAVIQELGYSPNRRAQSFATGKTRNILFLARMEHGVGFSNPHLFEILAGAENALSHKGYGLILRQSTPQELIEHYAELLCSEYVDGAILHASVVDKAVARALMEAPLPYIVVGMPDFANQLCWIDTNNSVAGQIAATHLLAKGHDRLAFIGGPKGDAISAHRLSGFLDRLEVDPLAGYIRSGEPTREGGYTATQALLTLPEPPSGIVCANQYIAYGCVQALKDAQKSIPQDVAVLTFDDFPFSQVLDPPLTVVNLDMYDMGEQAAKIVLRRIRRPQLLVQSQTTLPSLIERASTAGE